MQVVLGCGNFGGIGSAPAFFGQGETPEQAFALMDAAWGAGLRRFDTPDPHGGGGRPVRPPPQRPGALGRLAVDRVPLYRTHEPAPGTPIADTLAELERLRG